jgi:hypothetical protein
MKTGNSLRVLQSGVRGPLQKVEAVFILIQVALLFIVF